MGSTILIRNQASSICSGSNAFNINPASRIKHLFFIILRLISHNDAERLFTTVEKNREFLREWLPWVDETNTVEDINTFIRTSLKQYANNEGPVCVIVQDNDIIGIISFHGINNKNKSGGIGYWLSKDQNGKGIMTQCCKVIPEKIYESSLITLSKSRKDHIHALLFKILFIVEYGFNELGLNRITIPAAKINAKSRAIPERLGFTEEGTLREAEWLNDHFHDMVLYSVLKREWDTTED